MEVDDRFVKMLIWLDDVYVNECLRVNLKVTAVGIKSVYLPIYFPIRFRVHFQQVQINLDMTDCDPITFFYIETFIVCRYICLILCDRTRNNYNLQVHAEDGWVETKQG